MVFIAVTCPGRFRISYSVVSRQTKVVHSPIRQLDVLISQLLEYVRIQVIVKMSTIGTKQDKIRYDRLNLVCRKALEQVMKKALSLEQIKSCYPTIARTPEGLGSLEAARDQVINFWLTNSTKEFALLFSERELETKLNELDDIILLAQRRKNARSELPSHIDKMSPTKIIDATVVSESGPSVENLTMIYNQLCVDNEELFHELKQMTVEGEEIKSDINSLLKMLEKEMETLNLERSEFDLDELIQKMSD